MTKEVRPPAARIAGLAAVCAAGALAVPAVASAAPATSIMAGPVKVKDYSMTIFATDAKKDSFGVMFVRRAGKASQSHTYSFAKGVKVTTNKKLSTARIKGSLGKYGKVDLKLTGVGALKSGGKPKGCTGKSGKLRAGTLKGRFKLVADKTYFKTVSARSLKAQLARGGNLKCGDSGSGGSGGGVTTGGTMLTTNIVDGPEVLMLTVTKSASGAITQQAIRSDDPAKTGPASIFHMIQAPGTASAFTFSADLSSATATGISPFFSGKLSFTSEMPMGTMAPGTLSGDFAARFDSIGTQNIAAGSPDAMLMQS